MFYTLARCLQQLKVLEGIPSIGFSLTSYDPDANFNPSIKYIKVIFKALIENNMKKGTCLNVNIPAVMKKNKGN